MKRELYNEIENYMKACVKETAHDREHIYRVLGNCIKIAENETNVDYDILLAAALLHDIGRDGKKKNHNEIGAEMAGEFLKTTDFPKCKIGAVAMPYVHTTMKATENRPLLKQKFSMMPISWMQ